MIQNLIKTEKSFLTLQKVNPLDGEINNTINDVIIEIQDKLLIKPKIFIYGRECSQKRDVGFFSNSSDGYKYSGNIIKSQPISDNMEKLIIYINKLFNSNYNGILINRYDSGVDCIGAHSDEESLLDKSGVVALSWGAKRKFRIRDKIHKNIHMDIPLDHLTIINMGGDFQKEFTHEVPVQKRVKGMRISLTFRRHLK